MGTQENSHCAGHASCPAGGMSEPRFWRISQSLSSGNRERRWIERDHANESRITWGLVSTGIWFSGPRGLRWSETGRVWANLKGLYTFLMSFDFKDHRKPGKVLVGYYVPTIIFWIHLPSHIVGCLGEEIDFDWCQIMYPLFILAVVPNMVYFHLMLKTLSGGETAVSSEICGSN